MTEAGTFHFEPLKRNMTWKHCGVNLYYLIGLNPFHILLRELFYGLLRLILNIKTAPRLKSLENCCCRIYSKKITTLIERLPYFGWDFPIPFGSPTFFLH